MPLKEKQFYYGIKLFPNNYRKLVILIVYLFLLIIITNDFVFSIWNYKDKFHDITYIPDACQDPNVTAYKYFGAEE